MNLTPEEREELERLAEKPTAEQRMAKRARIILLADQGMTNLDIADEVDYRHETVGKWRQRWAQEGFDGLEDRARTGRPRKFSPDDRMTILEAVTTPPKDTSHWSLRDLQNKLETDHDLDISLGHLYNFLDDLDLQPHRVERWMTSKDPEFEEKRANIVGLYLDPPDNAFVLSVDEKSQIQCNTPTDPDKPLRPGTPQRREVHYERQGTQSLFAALAVHHGNVVGDVRDRHRSTEFVDFLNRLTHEFPNKELHVIVDNLATHKSNKVEDWLEEHPRVTLHFTPTYASWLNQIELWFSILERRLLDRGFFESLEEQRQAILGFIESYNEDAEPFEWTYSGDPLQV